MRTNVAFLACVCTIMLSTKLGLGTIQPECECLDTSFTPASSNGYYKVLNVWARDSDGTLATPVWSSLLWDTTFQFNLTAYWSDVTFGNLQYRGYDVFDSDTPAHYITIDTTLRIFDTAWIALANQPRSLRADSPYYDRRNSAPRMKFFYHKILEQVDDQVDFTDYDVNLDGYVDGTCQQV